MVRSPNPVHQSPFLTADFPSDRPAPPATITVPVSKIYGLLAGRYHRACDRRAAFRAAVPVISVGNITVGGTGKTPFTIALIRLIVGRFPQLAEPNKIAVLSRGYGRQSRELVVVETESDWAETGDEPLLIKRTLPFAVVVVSADRRLAASHTTDRLGSRLLILDDGFQHRRLYRDIDLVLIDGRIPLGNGHLLPAGPLREPAIGLRRASALIGIGEESAGSALLARQHGLPHISVRSKPILPAELSTDLSTPSFLLTSIARPIRFRNMLIENNVNIVGGRAYRDHYRYSKSDIPKIVELAKQSGAKRVITTAKDVIRLTGWPGTMPLLVCDVSLECSDSGQLLEILEPVLWASVEGEPAARGERSAF